MSHRSSQPLRVVYSLLLSCAVMAVMPAHAETPSRAALMSLARGFVDKVGGGFAQADRYLATIMPDDARADESFTSIPDGEILLLKIKLGRLPIADTIMGIKQGGDVMLSLRDFKTTARFAIDVKAAESLAEGWYISETQRFKLDVNAGTVVAGERQYTLSPGDVLVQDDDIFVRGQALAEWLDFNMTISLSDQLAKIDSAQKWPVVAMLERQSRRVRPRQSPPQLPRSDVEYTAVSLPFVAANARQSYVRSGGEGKGSSATSYNVTGAGDFLGHTLRTALTGNDEDKLSSARFTFSKESDKPDLLGPLKARQYEFGDISPTNVPLAGAAIAGLGVRASSGLGSATSSATTEIIGEGTPGWEVELERNGIGLALGVVGADGRYVFDEVPLTAGENLFTVRQYGPQGEEREELRRIVSSTSLAGGDKAVYDVSVTAANTEFWAKNDRESVDENNPQFSGLTEFQVTPEMTAAAGARSVTLNDERKNYLYAGAARSFGGFLANLNTAYDLDGAVAGNLAGRFRALGQSIGGTVSYTGENFGMVSGNTAPARYGLATTAGGRIYDDKGLQIYYDGRSEYNFVDDGSKVYDSTVNVNASYLGVSLGQSIQNLRTQDASGNDTKTVSGGTSLRGSLLGTRVRLNTNYLIKPEYDLRNYGVDLTRGLMKDVRGNLSINHQPNDRYTEARASLNWNAGRFTVSPAVTYDSERNLGAYVNLNVSTAYDAKTGKGVMSGRNLSNSGGFSAFVFLDKDGDRIFTEGADEPVRDATLRAIQANQIALTDDDGQAFIYTLPAGKVTDVVVEEENLPDPFWISAFEGVSIMPRPGYTAHAQFPLHMAGEIDGTVRVRRAGGDSLPLQGVVLHLYNSEGRQVRETAAASDGFYLFDRVAPGRYLLMISDADAKQYKIIRPIPQEITIGYDGTVIYGNDITVDSGSADVPVGFAAGLEDYMAANPHVSPADIAGGTVLLNLGSYRSQMLMGLVWYKIRARYAGIVGGGRLLVPPSQSYATPKTGLHELLVELPGVGVEDAFARCRQLAARGMVCGVEIIPPQGLKAAQAQGVGRVVN